MDRSIIGLIVVALILAHVSVQYRINSLTDRISALERSDVKLAAPIPEKTEKDGK